MFFFKSWFKVFSFFSSLSSASVFFFVQETFNRFYREWHTVEVLIGMLKIIVDKDLAVFSFVFLLCQLSERV